MQVPHQTATHVLKTPELQLALMDAQPRSKSGENFIRMIGQVSKQYAPISKIVLQSPKWVEYRVAQQEVEQIRTQVERIRTQVGEKSLDWM